MIFRLPLALLAPLALAAAVRADAIAVTQSGEVYRLDAIGAPTLIGSSGFTDLNSLGRDSSGAFWTAANGSATTPADLITIDPATGFGTLVASLSLGGRIRALTFDGNGSLYALVNDPGANDFLWRIDVATSTPTLVGDTGLTTLRGLCTSPAGVLYAWDGGTGGAPGLGLVLLSSSSATVLDLFAAADGGTDIQSLAFDASGELFGLRNELMRISEITGSTSSVGSPHGLNFRGFEFEDGMTVLNGALAVTFDGEVHRVNLDTGNSSFLNLAGFTRLNALARDPQTQAFIAVQSGTSLTPGALISISPLYGIGTQIALLDNETYSCATFTEDGTLYAVRTGSTLVTIDTVSGAITTLGNLAFACTALTTAPNDRLIAWNLTFGLLDIDPTIPAATFLSGGSGDVQTLAFDACGRLIGGRYDVLELDLATGSATTLLAASVNDMRGLEPFLPISLCGVPSSHCTAQINSLGCMPSIGWSGSAWPSLSQPTDFLLTASDIVAQRAGLLFYGINGPNGIPFLGGALCAVPPLQRTTIQFSGGTANTCEGVYSFDFNAHVASSTAPWFVPGARIDAQYWSRDPADPSGTNLTDAVGFFLAH